MSSLLRSCVAGVVIGLAGIVAAGCDSKEKVSGSAETADVSKALPEVKVKALLAGNTLEMHQLAKDKTVRRVYAQDGTFVPPGQSSDPNAGKGRWRIAKNSQQCIVMSPGKPERCFYITGNEQQGYAMASEDGEVVWKITAVVPGNLDKL